jgi:hypothetical protein
MSTVVDTITVFWTLVTTGASWSQLADYGVNTIVPGVSRWAQLTACLFVMGTCVCRLDMLKIKHNKINSILMYLLVGAFAAGTATDLWKNYRVDWYDSCGLFAWCVFVMRTIKDWRSGPPKDTVRGELEELYK